MLNFDAVIFDLDGVITQTALVHGTAWKRVFDDFLRFREEKNNEPFREFTHINDYLPYVDGKPRYKGVASFLESRGISIPYGDPGDDPEQITVCGLGNKKNKLFNEVLKTEGVKVYETTISLIRELKNRGIRIGVASSSKNCKLVLERAGLLDYFETRVDGIVSTELGLKGKPEPDIFTVACDNLGIEYHRAVVVEDAVSGVQAGSNGNFGFVLGVARENNEQELQANGADIVVTDLGEISVEAINSWFMKGLDEDNWSLQYFDYDLEKERSREALLTIGNGYFGTRGALEESRANQVNYPGTYIAGLYNRLISKVAGRDIENEDFVNISNWLPVRFKPADGEWFGFQPDPTFTIEKIRRHLNFKTGELNREMIIQDPQGHRTQIHTSRFASMENPHCAGLQYSITPLNYSGVFVIQSELNGNHINAGVERYNQLNQKHLKPISEVSDNENIYLVVSTTGSNTQVAQAARHIINTSDSDSKPEMNVRYDSGWIRSEFRINVKQNQKVTLQKLVTIFTSMDQGVDDPFEEARQTLQSMDNYAGELKKSIQKWGNIWNSIDIQINGDRLAQKLIRLHLYHMMVTASPHTSKLDVGIPPRGLHGEAYRGHIFWDELYILPLYNIYFPEVVRSTLLYRFRRLDKAREYAREYGYCGAMFPWQSGSDGREETQVVHQNPVSGEWGDDYSSLQRHISLAIAYNIWNYYMTSLDHDFMVQYGFEMFLEICRFWVSKSEFDPKDQKYHIGKVMGPDEFHEKYPEAVEGGIKDNAYTNIMVSWALNTAFRILDSLNAKEGKEILSRIKLNDSELNEWNKIKRNIALDISEDGIIAHFEGYFKLKELEWEYYRQKYTDIHRLDRILKAEGKSPDEFKLSKQADLLMAFFLLGPEEVLTIIRNLGYQIPEECLEHNFNYYISRTSHGSTLSRLVHADLAYTTGKSDLGWQLYLEALKSDLTDIQGGTTGEGIHCGVMAGTVFSALSIFCGLDLSSEVPKICPDLPDNWKSIKFTFLFRGIIYKVAISKTEVKIICRNDKKNKIKIHLCGREYKLLDNQLVSFKL